MTTENTILNIYKARNGFTVVVGSERLARFKWAYGGHTDVILESFDGLTIQGWCEQGEKAGDICRLWVERGQIFSIFNEENRLDLLYHDEDEYYGLPDQPDNDLDEGLPGWPGDYGDSRP